MKSNFLRYSTPKYLKSQEYSLPEKSKSHYSSQEYSLPKKSSKLYFYLLVTLLIVIVAIVLVSLGIYFYYKNILTQNIQITTTPLITTNQLIKKTLITNGTSEPLLTTEPAIINSFYIISDQITLDNTLVSFSELKSDLRYITDNGIVNRSTQPVISNSILKSNNKKFHIRGQALFGNIKSTLILGVYEQLIGDSKLIKNFARVNFDENILKYISYINFYIINNNGNLDLCVESKYDNEILSTNCYNIINSSSISSSLLPSEEKNKLIYQITDDGNFYAFRNSNKISVLDILLISNISLTNLPIIITQPPIISELKFSNNFISPYNSKEYESPGMYIVNTIFNNEIILLENNLQKIKLYFSYNEDAQKTSIIKLDILNNDNNRNFYSKRFFYSNMDKILKNNKILYKFYMNNEGNLILEILGGMYTYVLFDLSSYGYIPQSNSYAQLLSNGGFYIFNNNNIAIYNIINKTVL